MNINVAIMYVAFFGRILGATYLTGSAWCLWALLLTPSWPHEKED